MKSRSRNKNAATFSFLALLSLALAINLPMMTFHQFGEKSSYSILQSIAVLIGNGDFLLGVLILIFSVIFPLLKLAVFFAFSIGIIGAFGFNKTLLLQIAKHGGKFSMLDVFVIAILVVVLEMDGVAEVKLEYGTYFFLVAIFLSIISAVLFDSERALDLHRVDDDAAIEGNGNMRRGNFSSGVNGVKPSVPIWTIIVPILGAVFALIVWAVSPIGNVESILVEKRPGIDINIFQLPGNPDISLRIVMKNGEVQRTTTKEDTPLGNGILFPITPILLDDINEVVAWDDNSLMVFDTNISIIPDELIDRVRINRERIVTGQKLRFSLQGSISALRIVAYVVGSVSALALLILGLSQVRRLASSKGH